MKFQPVLTAVSCAILLFATGPQAQAQGDLNERCNQRPLLPAKISCFLKAAEAARQPALCDEAEDQVVRFQCLSLYAEHSRDMSPCERITATDGSGEAMRDACKSGVAIAARQPDLCDRVAGSGLRDSCYMMLVVQFGSDLAFCDKIHNPELKSACTD